MPHKTIKALAFLAVALLAPMTPAAALAQTIGQTVSNDGFGGEVGQGQSFTATVTGNVTEIAIRPGSNVIGDTLRLYDGALGSNTTGTPGVADYTQTVATTSLPSDTSPMQVFVLDTPFPVTAGDTYSFTFDATILRANSTDPYADGTFIRNYSDLDVSHDAAFQVTQVAAAAAVPTLSEWAMILFGLVLAGGAALVIQRRRMAL